MSTLIQCNRISHRAGTNLLFKDLDLTINEGDRIGLVGHNGCGKSTLFRLLSGVDAPDDGDISRSRDLTLETVEQFIDPSLFDLTLARALAGKLPEEERAFGDYKVTMLLAQLGFSEAQFEHKVRDLSGGQQNRLMFARAVLNEPNLILFDEPTNHLDLRTLLYFEDFLRAMAAGYVLVSHDRQFLDAVTNRTLFLRDQRIYSFALPFSAARDQLQAQDEAAAARREAEEKNIRDLRASAKRIALWGKVYDNEKLAAKAKNMEKRIERLEEEKTFVSRGSGLSLSLDVQQSRANRMLQIEDRHITAPGPDAKPLFYIEDFYLRPGDRVALLGHNGTGKTTLIKLMMDRYAHDREGDMIKFNPQCRIGYYDQELGNLDPDNTLVETLRVFCRGADNDHKSALIKAGFPYLDLDKKVRVLSGGEKARLMFLIIKLNQPNFLVLDEPTNHIDIEGKEELETQILEAGATVLITSHDRRFVDNIARRFVLIKNGKLVEINDPETFYREDREDRNGTERNARQDDRDMDTRTLVDDLESEDDILARLIELEARLAADLARKPKFQKQDRQAVWRKQIEALARKLEQD